MESAKESFLSFSVPAGFWTITLGILTLGGIELTPGKLIIFGFFMLVIASLASLIKHHIA